MCKLGGLPKVKQMQTENGKRVKEKYKLKGEYEKNKLKVAVENN